MTASFKRLTILTIIALSPLFAQAQRVYKGADASEKFKNTQLVRDSKFSALPSYIEFRSTNQMDRDELKQWMVSNFKLADGMNFDLVRVESDLLGHEHYRFQQTLNGAPIEDAIWIVHTNNDRVYSLNGLIYNAISCPTTAGISEAAALENALTHVGATTYKWELAAEERHLKWEKQDLEATYHPTAELVFVSANYSFLAEDYRLAYKFNIYAQEPISRADIYVDAITGEILRENEIIHHVDEPGTAHTAYSGERDIIADSFEGEYRLRDGSRGDGVRTFDLNNATSHGGAVDFIDDDNDWDNVNPEKDEYATDAHWGAEMTYDYFNDIHGRNSIDNDGFQLNSYVHYGVNYFNAFWDGSRMTYGDGNGGAITPLTSIDIAAHEVTHGLTTFSAGLIYYAESGALNESFSDIFGAAIERFARPDDYNWLLGEDIGTHFRNMANPNAKNDPDTYFGTYWADLGGGDAGGVHTNSGVQNFWYYLLTEGGTGTNDNGDDYDVTALGVEASSAIAFRNLTVYLVSSSQYADARFYALKSAQDLFGGCTEEVEQTANAWYAVGVGDEYDPTTTADFTTLDTFGCAIPFEVNFVNESFNGITYEWDFGDGGTSTDENPTHIYTEAGIYTVTLSVDGGACGSADITKTSYIEVDPDADCILILPPSGTLGTQTACDGTLYDSGGPDANYGSGENAQITIDPLGAVSVNLTFPEFDVEAGVGVSCNYDYLEIYDGPSAFDPLIGRYCNNNLPTDITSTGSAITLFFHSDGYVQDPGFEIIWSCNPPEDVPETDFTVNSEITCSGTAYFTDLSTNIPIFWEWDFGDGETSSEQHPIHTYTEEGDYTVTLTATNLVGDNTEVKTEYITVAFPEPPTTTNDTNCVEQSATLIASGEGTLKWYTEAEGGVPFFEGEIYDTPLLDETTTYYVEDDLYDSPENVGPETADFGTGDYFSGDQHLVFNNSTPVFLKSVVVYAGSAGERTIELRNNVGTVLESVTRDIDAGEQTFILDLFLPVGTSLQLGVAEGDDPDLYRNDSGTSYPYTLDESVEIVGSSTGDEFYYYFYNWEVHPYDCASERTAVTAVVEFESDILIDEVEFLCIEDEPMILTASEEGGIWTADCADCINEETGEFDPATAGIGTWEITYWVDGTCSHFNTTTIEVKESDITIDPVEDLCKDDEALLLTASIDGGTWSATCGDCIDEASGLFDPLEAGVGTWDITYSVPGTCSHYNMIAINVVESAISIDPVDDICIQASPVILNASEGGGTWSADCADCIDSETGEFDPIIAGAGTWEITYSVPGTCSHYNTQIVNVVDCLGLPGGSLNQISIYPNPTNGIITISTGQVSQGTIVVKDVIGKTIFILPFNSNTLTVDLNQYHARGTYFVEFYDQNAGLIDVKKVVKH